MIVEEFEKLTHSHSNADHDRLIHILGDLQDSPIGRLVLKETFQTVAKHVFEQISPLAESRNEDDIMRYLETVGMIAKTLDSAGALKTGDFVEYLNKIIKTNTYGFSLRKEAVFEKLLLTDHYGENSNFKHDLSGSELSTTIAEIKDWPDSPDRRKKRCATESAKKLEKALETGAVATLEMLKFSGLVDVNQKSLSGFSMLQKATYYDQKTVIDWLVGNPEFDLNQKNRDGFCKVNK